MTSTRNWKRSSAKMQWLTTPWAGMSYTRSFRGTEGYWYKDTTKKSHKWRSKSTNCKATVMASRRNTPTSTKSSTNNWISTKKRIKSWSWEWRATSRSTDSSRKAWSCCLSHRAEIILLPIIRNRLRSRTILSSACRNNWRRSMKNSRNSKKMHSGSTLNRLFSLVQSLSQSWSSRLEESTSSLLK